MSALRSSAVMGASRWLDANTLAETNVSTARANATLNVKAFITLPLRMGLQTATAQKWTVPDAAPRPGAGRSVLTTFPSTRSVRIRIGIVFELLMAASFRVVVIRGRPQDFPCKRTPGGDGQ